MKNRKGSRQEYITNFNGYSLEGTQGIVARAVELTAPDSKAMRELHHAKKNVEQITNSLVNYMGRQKNFYEDLESVVTDKDTPPTDRVRNLLCKYIPLFRRKDEYSLGTTLQRMLQFLSNAGIKLEKETEKIKGEFLQITADLDHLVSEQKEDYQKMTELRPLIIKRESELKKIEAEYEIAKNGDEKKAINKREKIAAVRKEYDELKRKFRDIGLAYKLSINTYDVLQALDKSVKIITENCEQVSNDVKVTVSQTSPLFNRVVGVVKLVELQQKPLEVYDVLKKGANTALLAIAHLSNAAENARTSIFDGSFIEEETLVSIKHLNKKTLDLRRDKLNQECRDLESRLDNRPGAIEMSTKDGIYEAKK